MFFTKYLPINIKRKNAAIYTSQAIYPATFLRMAHDAVVDGVGLNTEVVLENGIISFPKNPEYQWTIPDVYLAYEALITAEENNFSLYSVCNKEGIPQLFVSKSFKQHRLLVNALTFKAVIVTKPNLVKRISAMIDRQFENTYCMYLFDVINDLENGSTKYLEAIICDRGTEDECMKVNPITTLYSDDNTIYSKEVIEDYRTLLENPEAETEYVCIQDDLFCRKNVKGYAPLPTSHVKAMVELYDKLLAKKCNYLDVLGDDSDTHYFISTNWRYFVNARTFECVIITNSNLKKLLQSYVANGNTPVDQLTMLWMIAIREPK